MEEAENEGFSIREYTRNVRSVDIRKCCPFSGEFAGDFIHSLLPPLTVVKFRWWSHKLTSLQTKSPDDPKPAFREKANAESILCKKRSIGETTTNDIVLLKKKIKTKKLEDYKVYNCEEQARERADENGKCSLGIKERSGVMSPTMNKPGVQCFSYTEEQLFPDYPRSDNQDCGSEIHGTLKVAKRKVCSVRSLDDKSSIDASQCERQVRFSLNLCCSQMNLLSLSSAAEDQSPKVMSNDQTSDNMLFQPMVPERRLKSSISCFPGPHLSLERIKEALDLERKRRLAQRIQSSNSTLSEIHYRSCSSSLSQHCGTLLNRSSFDPLLVVEANGSSRSAAAQNDILVDLSSGRKHSTTETALARDVGRSSVCNEKQYKYYPARLGLDETFTENVSDTNDVECGQAVHALVSEANLRSHAINLPKQDGLCLHNTQSTMRLMGKDVSVGERIIDYSFLESYAQQSWLWRTIEDNHTITSLDKSWNRDLLCDDTSKDTTPFPMFCEPPQVTTYPLPDSELPHTLLYPCGSSLMSCPLTDKDLYFHESGLGQQLNSVTFSQQQLPFPSDSKIAGLPLHWPQSFFESSCLDMPSFNPTELS